MIVPIIIVSYNNYKYVENTMKQIYKINQEYYHNIIIMDNNSNDIDTINFLKGIQDIKVFFNETNSGPWVNSTCNSHIYDIMPDKFIVTDPDLEFNENLPFNFIEIMTYLSDKYAAYKLGFALKIDDFSDMYDTNNYFAGRNIYEWEKQFWNMKLNDENYDLYRADIDTTFCIINKNITESKSECIRIGGNFTARHLPWYITKNDIFNINEKYILYNKQTSISTISHVTKIYINSNYTQIYKNDVFFLIQNTDPYIDFWVNKYSNYETEKFVLFDNYANKNKTIIDIGNELVYTSIF